MYEKLNPSRHDWLSFLCVCIHPPYKHPFVCWNRKSNQFWGKNTSHSCLWCPYLNFSCRFWHSEGRNVSRGWREVVVFARYTRSPEIEHRQWLCNFVWFNYVSYLLLCVYITATENIRSRDKKKKRNKSGQLVLHTKLAALRSCLTLYRRLFLCS